MNVCYCTFKHFWYHRGKETSGQIIATLKIHLTLKIMDVIKKTKGNDVVDMIRNKTFYAIDQDI